MGGRSRAPRKLILTASGGLYQSLLFAGSREMRDLDNLRGGGGVCVRMYVDWNQRGRGDLDSLSLRGMLHVDVRALVVGP